MKKYTFDINQNNRYDKEILEKVVELNNTLKDILIDLNLKPIYSNYRTLKKHINIFDLDITHLKTTNNNHNDEIYNYDTLYRASKNSLSLTDMLKYVKLRAAGGNYRTLKKYIDLYNIDISHFNSDEIRKEKLKQITFKNKKELSEILVENSSYSRTSLKHRLYEEGIKERKCELCGQNENWNGKKISLILDHKNGTHDDNRLWNLRIVCPNCNATLDTHCGKNNSKRSKKLIENNFNINDVIDFRKTLTKENINSSKKRRIVERPTFEQLKFEIETLGYRGTGRKYGVSDNSIRKWEKNYEKNNF